MTVLAAVVLLSAAVLAVLLASGRLSSGGRGRTPALRIGGVSYTAAECSYFYQSLYQTLLQAANGGEAWLGLDPGRPLDEQPCPLDEQGGTWAAYLLEKTCAQMAETTALWQSALEAGETLTEDAQAELAYLPEYYALEAADAGYGSADAYLAAQYGAGMDVRTLQTLTERIRLAQQCENRQLLAFSFDDAQLQAYYAAHLGAFSTYSYLYAYLGAASSETAAALCRADSREAFERLAQEYTGRACHLLDGVAGDELGDAAQPDVAWLLDGARRPGDTYAGRAGESLYVLYFLSRDDGGFSAGETHWKTVAAARLRAAQLASWKAERTAACPVETLPGAKFIG